MTSTAALRALDEARIAYRLQKFWVSIASVLVLIVLGVVTFCLHGAFTTPDIAGGVHDDYVDAAIGIGLMGGFGAGGFLIGSVAALPYSAKKVREANYEYHDALEAIGVAA